MSYRHQYDAAGVQKLIDQDKRIKPAEARLIHALLRGRQPIQPQQKEA